MLEIAVLSRSQHVQLASPGDPLVLRKEGEHWAVVEECSAADSHPFLEILRREDAVRIRGRGVERCESLDGSPLDVAQGVSIALPATLTVDGARLELADANAAGAFGSPDKLQRLERQDQPLRDPNAAGGPAAETMLHWFEGLTTLHREARSLDGFLEGAARFVVEVAGLDAGYVWRREECPTEAAPNEEDQWRIAASCIPNPELGVLVDRRLLEVLLTQPAVWLHGANDVVAAQTAVVLAPIHDASGALTGAVMGARAVHGGNGRRGVRYLEGHLLKALAESASAAIALAEHEAEAARSRSLFERAFPPAVARQLLNRQDALRPTEREVTVLFADVEGFSTKCERLTTVEAYELLRDVMECLTQAVLQNQGAIIDYYGDGLAAMWNAPLDQPGHPALACRAALDMVEGIPGATERWQERLGEPIAIGVGVHTGMAQVGNAGTTRRLKYGPRGATVNIAHRVESATRKLGAPVLATRAVASRVSGEVCTVRVCEAQLSGVDTPLDLFAVRRPATDERVMASLDRYEAALEKYERGELIEACQLLEPGAEAASGLPVQFLVNQVKQGCAQQLGRRKCDRDAANPLRVIDLRGK